MNSKQCMDFMTHQNNFSDNNFSNKFHSHELKFTNANNSKRNHSHEPKIILHWTGTYRKKYLGVVLQKNWYQKYCPLQYGTGNISSLLFDIPFWA